MWQLSSKSEVNQISRHRITYMSVSLTWLYLGHHIFQSVQHALPWCLEELSHFSLMSLPKSTACSVTTARKLSGSPPKGALLHGPVTAHLCLLKSMGAYLPHLIAMLLLWDRKRGPSAACWQSSRSLMNGQKHRVRIGFSSSYTERIWSNKYFLWRTD